MNHPTVSVVTPFYNTAEWLAECIESVLAQTLPDFEYILVDNASTDGGGDIAESYAKRDKRIRVLRTNRLLPQVDNYNFALSQISPHTKYCKIAQADDWLYPEFLRATVDLADGYEDMILVCTFTLEGTGVVPTGIEVKETVLSGRDACRTLFCRGRYPFGSPTNQLWRADVVRARRPFYDADAVPFEDADVCFELLNGRSFGFVHQVLSFTRRDEGSIFDALKRFAWTPAFRLAILRRWGKAYLTDAEYASLHETWRRDYRAILAEAKARGASERYFAFHQEMMAAGRMEDIGENLSLAVLAWYFDRLANPKRTCENLLRYLKNRGKSPSSCDPTAMGRG
jgi:glycosyltransferase involved in cell wall biosynthesis